MIREHCAAVGLPEPVMLDEPPGTSGRSVDFRHRTEGRRLLLHAQAGDVLVVTKLDRLGRIAKDILDTLERLATRGVRVPKIWHFSERRQGRFEAGFVQSYTQVLRPNREAVEFDSPGLVRSSYPGWQNRQTSEP